MATASSRDVRSASATWRSHDLATMQATGAPASRRLASTASCSGLTPARRVEPNATSVAVPSVSSFLARAKNSTSLGFAPGQPPSM